MIVVDASVVVGWLLQTPGGGRFGTLLSSKEPLAAPHLLDAEVGHAVRRQSLIGRLTTDRATAALTDFLDLGLERYPHVGLLERAFALRHDATIYDALYIALAERLDVPLLTLDRALTLIPNTSVAIEIAD